MATTTASSETVSGDADGTEVKAKPSSVLRRKRTVMSDHDNGDDRTDVGMVCVQCFRFLKALANDYVEVQER